ncbi:hypothetical protein DDF67_23930 [Caulobacter endophyticus]|uniref:Uncharacterized protein n=2 Tax=Caulobacter endophyticus TaxID=2172652 RepID=A0A2T9JEE3_9CAUL|nr:hypothetical protein DDF67_23930 [Caulobacter endophyticus]
MNTKGKALRPAETIQRVMISTTSYFVGEFCTDDTLISHAWPRSGDRRANMHFFEDSPLSRCAFVISFETPPPVKQVGAAVPQYAPTADFYAAAMSVLYGKRFDAHGSLENSGSFNVPSMEAYTSFCDPLLPHNTKRPRVDLGFPLSLEHVERVYRIFDTVEETPAHDAFHAAGRFYARALRAAESDPESAYLHLITAAELISNAHLPAGERLLDDELESDVQRIAGALPDGAKVASRLRRRLFEVKRRFVQTFLDFIDDDFFNRSESEDPIWGLKRDQFRVAISAAYDLRSQYVHSGATFGNWVEATRRLHERQVGRPVVRDPAMSRILFDAPTLIGLERLTRYMILKFAQAHLKMDLTIPQPA